MAVYIELTTDPFEANYARLKERNSPELSRSGRAGLVNVRRPLRGLELKEDTYACLKVLRSDGSEIPFRDSSDASGFSMSYSNFILQSVQEARMEKHQIVETFGDTYLYLFGESPRFLDIQAVLLDSNDYNWEAEWWYNWEHTLRGSRTAERGARVYLFYNDTVVEGYFLTAQAAKSSTEPVLISMTTRMFVSSARNVSMVGDPNFPVQDSVYIPPDVTLTSAEATRQMAEYLNANGSRILEGTERNSVGALRGVFADNVDEYTGSTTAYLGVGSDQPRSYAAQFSEGTGSTYPGMFDDLPENVDPRIRDQLEVDDLFYTAIRWMSCFGAGIDDYSTLSGMGLGVSFSAGTGVSLGIGASSSGGATFGAVASGVSFGMTTGASVSSSVSGTLETGYGDSTYGYASPYGGPGYGQSGFGDYGGLGFGSGFGNTGDPGYVAPSAFTQAGVENTDSDLARLLAARKGYGSGIGGVAADASLSGVGGGATVSVGGACTAFSLVVVEGTLDPTGNALSATGRRLGLTNENPYDVPCLGGSGPSQIDLLSMV